MHLIKATNIDAVDILGVGGAAGVYLVLGMGEQQHFRSKLSVRSRSVSSTWEWDQHLELLVHDAIVQQLSIHLFSKELVKKDELLGSCEIGFADCGVGSCLERIVDIAVAKLAPCIAKVHLQLQLSLFASSPNGPSKEFSHRPDQLSISQEITSSE